MALAETRTEAEYPGRNNHDMSQNHDSKIPTPPPQAQLLQMATARWISHIAYVAAKLSLADHLANGPKGADELAGETGTHAPSLYRLMRTLASVGILTEDASRRFALPRWARLSKPMCPARYAQPF